MISNPVYVNYPTSFRQPVEIRLPSTPSNSNDKNIMLLYFDSKKDDLEQCFSRLDKLNNYENDWDGNASVKPNRKAIEHARLLLVKILNMSFSNKIKWINPLISADSDGNIVFEWWGKSDKKITFYIGEDQPIEYIKSHSIKISEMEDGQIPTFLPINHSDLFGWLTN